MEPSSIHYHSIAIKWWFESIQSESITIYDCVNEIEDSLKFSIRLNWFSSDQSHSKSFTRILTGPEAPKCRAVDPAFRPSRAGKSLDTNVEFFRIANSKSLCPHELHAFSEGTFYATPAESQAVDGNLPICAAFEARVGKLESEARKYSGLSDMLTEHRRHTDDDVRYRTVIVLELERERLSLGSTVKQAIRHDGTLRILGWGASPLSIVQTH